MQEHNISFSKGLNRDIAKNKFPEGYYSHLLNGRILSSNDSTSYDIINLKGNDNANIIDKPTDIPTSRVGFVIIGYTTLLNDIVLFFAEDTATGLDNYTTESCIDVLEYQGNDSYYRREVWRGTGMNFRIDKPIEAVGRYENPDLQKIYWVDDNENMRYCIITEDNSSNTLGQFDLIGDFNINENTAPKFNRYTSGSKKPGMNYYSYRWVKKHGQTSLYSPLSKPIPTARKIAASSTAQLKGDDIYDPDTDYNSNVGVEVLLTNDFTEHITMYDYIEVVSLWYSSKNGIPDISIIYKGLYKNLILDDGYQSYGTIDYGDFLSQQSDFSAKTLAIKDDILFAGNIKEKHFDLDEYILKNDPLNPGLNNDGFWDSRSYRFDDDRKARLYSQGFTDGNDYDIEIDGTSGTLNTDFKTIPETHDCFNIYNKITPTKSEYLNNNGLSTGDYGQHQRYNNDNATNRYIGGSGLNINYQISYSLPKFNNPVVSKDYDNLTLDDSNTFNYTLGLDKAFQSDEVYRFGIIFIDKKGRSSFVKWIGDIRMPDLTKGNRITQSSTTDVYSRPLKLNFHIKNIPDGLSCKIVRVKREAKDKTISFSGIASPIMKVEGYWYTGADELLFPFKMLSLKQWTGDYSNVSGGSVDGAYSGLLENTSFQNDLPSEWYPFYKEPHRTLLEIRSPEISFDISKPNVEYLEVAGLYNSLEWAVFNRNTIVSPYTWNTVYEGQDAAGPKRNFAVTKYNKLHEIYPSHNLYQNTCSIIDAAYTNQNASGDAEEKVGNFNVKLGADLVNINMIVSSAFIGGGKFTVFQSSATRCALISTGSDILDGLSDYTSDYGLYIYVRQNVWESQYGGYSYEDRSQNIYITSSNIAIKGIIGEATVVANQGDTFIKSVTNRRLSAKAKGAELDDDGDYVVDKDKFASLSDDMIYITETTINTDLKYNDDYFDYRTSPLENSDALTMVESGTVSSDTGVSLNALCKYNFAYSHENDAVKFFPKPVLFEEVDEFTTLVKYSNTKYNNEDYDSWLQFRPNNNFSLETTHGPLNKLIEFSNLIYSFQNSAFGLLNINPQAIVNSTNGEISLGTGATIQNVQYITTDVGCQNKSDVIKSKSAMYWLCNNNKKLYTFNGQLGSISDIKGLHSYLDVNINEDSRLIGTYDNKNSEVLLTVLDEASNTEFIATYIGIDLTLSGALTGKNLFIPGQVYKIEDGWFKFIEHNLYSLEFEYMYGVEITTGTIIDLSNYFVDNDNFTVAYNELIGAFTSFYSFIPSLYIKNDVGYFSSNNNLDLWQHDISEYYNYFYNISYPTSLSFILNYQSQMSGEFTNLKFFSEVKDNKGNYLRNETISNISVKNNYQESKEVLLYPMTLPEDHTSLQRNTYDTSGLRIGLDWYAGITGINTEQIVIYENQMYRSDIDNNLSIPPTNYTPCELCNIRKTVEQWSTQIPRFNYLEGDVNYPTSDRIRSDWAEVTVKLQDIVNPTTLREKNFKISDIIVKSDVILL